MKEPKLRVDLEFLGAFFNAFFSKHIKWLQRHDKVAKSWVYCSQNMVVQYFIMQTDKQDLCKNWRSNPHFEEFKKAAKNLKREHSQHCIGTADSTCQDLNNFDSRWK